MKFTVREATEQDIPGIIQCAAETWHDTYEDILGPRTIAAELAEYYNQQAIANHLKRPNSTFLVAEYKSQIIGFAQAYDHGPLVELARLYVLPHYQRKGVGSALLRKAAEFVPAGKKLSLNVHRDNDKARNFYEKHGFRNKKGLYHSQDNGRLIHLLEYDIGPKE